MITIGNSDQAMALVRGQLERMARSKQAKSAGKPATSRTAGASEKTRLQALGRLAGAPDEEFERTLVHDLLTLEFGEDVSRDARFQSVVDQTARVLREDPAMAGLIAEASAHLRNGV